MFYGLGHLFFRQLTLSLISCLCPILSNFEKETTNN